MKNENRTTSLVSYQGRVYHWESVFRTRRARMAMLAPAGGGEMIAARVLDLRILPGPGMRTTYECAGSAL